MAISKKIIKYLDDNKYRYEVIQHRTTYTAWDTAQTEKVKPQEVAKSLVLKTDKDYIVAVVPSNKNLDKKKLLKIINTKRKKEDNKSVKKVEFAKETWMKKNIDGKVGATPPFAGILKTDIYVDKSLLNSSKIYLGSGEYDASIRVSTKEYLKKENPITGSFNMKK
ncbi:prolyl-tRNA synthetase [bacterium BMS3Abin15]|nr:prolyl-tRNA synthetase [bacterium BMS3Abin15]HDZ84941.1 YbaK/EbsC family protein [Candidatus Moranbacteria bacterium]